MAQEGTTEMVAEVRADVAATRQLLRSMVTDMQSIMWDRLRAQVPLPEPELVGLLSDSLVSRLALNDDQDAAIS